MDPLTLISILNFMSILDQRVCAAEEKPSFFLLSSGHSTYMVAGTPTFMHKDKSDKILHSES